VKLASAERPEDQQIERALEEIDWFRFQSRVSIE
jgi:hypothetical protein